MNYWLHRISYHAEVAYPLLEKGILTIGFSDFSEQSFIDDILSSASDEKWLKLEEHFWNNWGNAPKTRYNLWRFIEGFKNGDKILVPSWGVFSIYEITSDQPATIDDIGIDKFFDWNNNEITIKDGLLYREQDLIDLGFFWQVKPIETQISRYEFADTALTARMKIRNTNAQITDIQESIEKAISAFKENKPINLHSQIIENLVPNILNILKTEITPGKLEYLVKWYFERIGATDVYIPAKNESNKDGDADVVATFEPLRTIIYAQVKHHDGETNSWAVHQIVDYKNKKENSEYMDDEYSRITWVISTAESYSDECFKLAKAEKVQLINGTKFTQMLIEAGILNLDKAL